MRKIRILLTILVIILLTGGYLNFIRKPVIVITDQQLNFSNIAVEAFPLTEKGKINWWQNNKSILKNEFHIPVAAKNGDWYLSIWDYGSGFKAKPDGDIRIFNSDTQDMKCFNNNNEKCIDKKLLMRVENNPNGGAYIQIDNIRIPVK